MKMRVAQSIYEFALDEWDAVAGDELLMTHRWQRVMEACRRSYQPRYLLLEDQHGPYAAVIANAAESIHSSRSRALELSQALVISAPYSARDCGVALRPGVELADALPAIERGLARLARSMHRTLLVVSNVADADRAAWQGQQFVTLPQPAYNVIELNWSSHAAYLAALDPKQRSELRRMRRRAESMAVRFTREPLVEDDEWLYPLLCEVYARHGTLAAQMPFGAELFPALARELPGEVLLFKGFVGEELAGYLLCLPSGDTVGWPAAGLRYELAHPSYLYFLLIDEMIGWGIEQGYRRILGGLTNEREKQKFGFTQRARWLCVRARSPLLNPLLTTALPLALRLGQRRDRTAREKTSPSSPSA